MTKHSTLGTIIGSIAGFVVAAAITIALFGSKGHSDVFYFVEEAKVPVGQIVASSPHGKTIYYGGMPNKDSFILIERSGRTVYSLYHSVDVEMIVIDWPYPDGRQIRLSIAEATPEHLVFTTYWGP